MTYPTYPAYKDSGVAWLGAVPEHWEVKPLKRLASVNDDVLTENVSKDYTLCYVDISSVDTVEGIVTKEEMLFANAPSRARRRVRDGDIIVSTVRTYLKAIARVENPEDNLIVSTGFAVIRPSSALNPHYAGYVCGASYFIEHVIARSVGVSYPAINASDLMRIAIPTPPLPEQATIAAFLDRETATIAATIARQERMIALLREKRQALIARAVTQGLDADAPMKDSGVAWLGAIPAHWRVKRLRNCFTTIEQGWSPQCENRPAEVGEWGVLKVGCVNQGHFNPLENKALPDGIEPMYQYAINRDDVLVSRANTRELVGSAALATQDYPNLLLCDKLYRLRLDESQCSPVYAVMLLRSAVARSQMQVAATGASFSMVNIGQETIKNLAFALPTIEEQKAIVCYVHDSTHQIDTLIAKSQQAIALLREHRTALIAAAVTGKIDVRGAGETASVEDEALTGMAR